MTTASLSFHSPIYTADSPGILRVSVLKPGELLGSCSPSDGADVHFDVGQPATQPRHPVLRHILEELRTDPRVKKLTVTNYGLDVEHDCMMPSEVLRLIEAGIAHGEK